MREPKHIHKMTDYNGDFHKYIRDEIDSIKRGQERFFIMYNTEHDKVKNDISKVDGKVIAVEKEQIEIKNNINWIKGVGTAYAGAIAWLYINLFHRVPK